MVCFGVMLFYFISMLYILTYSTHLLILQQYKIIKWYGNKYFQFYQQETHSALECGMHLRHRKGNKMGENFCNIPGHISPKLQTTLIIINILNFCLVNWEKNMAPQVLLSYFALNSSKVEGLVIGEVIAYPG